MARSNQELLVRRLPVKLREQFERFPPEWWNGVQELRLRAGSPIYVKTAKQWGFLDRGTLVSSARGAFLLSAELLRETFHSLCADSVQRIEEELKRGFFSMEGGHRIGVYGEVITRQGEVLGFSSQSSLVLRVAHEVPGSARAIVQRCCQQTLPSVLLYGLPGSGKTTLLRDFAAELSAGCTGRPFQVAVLDERGELAALSNGRAQFALGPCTDVYSLCPKALALEMALRAGAPELMVCDELGGEEDLPFLLSGMAAGVAVAASAHAASFEGLLRRPALRRLYDASIFDWYILLSEGRPVEFRDEKGRVVA